MEIYVKELCACALLGHDSYLDYTDIQKPAKLLREHVVRIKRILVFSISAFADMNVLAKYLQ
jgi:hypothetical protein